MKERGGVRSKSGGSEGSQNKINQFHEKLAGKPGKLFFL
jgi:hypothetical protein